MIDLDDVIKSGKIIKTIKTCFKYNTDDWDVLTGNQSELYYDIWAFRQKDVLESDYWENHLKDIKNGMNSNDSLHKNLHVFEKKKEANGLIKVMSAFGGIAIYKINSIENCTYNGIIENNKEICEHVPFHLCMNDNKKNIYINTEMLTD
jgi:hypothetical protein